MACLLCAPIQFHITFLPTAHFVCDPAVCDMAKMSAAKVDMGTEKKDVCILVELVSGVGFAFENLKEEVK